MPSESFPVFVQSRGGERTRVGTATRAADGSFTLQLGELVIGSQAVEQAAPRRESYASGGGGGSAGGAVFPNYGRSKGAPIQGASMQDLEFYANGARRSLADPSKERFHDKERALLGLIEAEIARQRGGGGGDEGGGFGDEPPPHDDEDNIPF